MLKHFFALGLIVGGCAGGSDPNQLSVEQASDPSYWMKELGDTAHRDLADRAKVIGQYLEQAPAETKAQLVKETEFFSACTQHLRMADSLHHAALFEQSIAEYQAVGNEGCGLSASSLARRIGFASIEVMPDEYPQDEDLLKSYITTLTGLERDLTGAERDQLSYEIAAVEFMATDPDGPRLHALVERALAQLSGNEQIVDIEGVLRTIVIVSNAGGLEIGDASLVAKAAQADYWLHRRFGYSVL